MKHNEKRAKKRPEARKLRLREARMWFKSQNFTDDSHIVKAYRKQFNVDRTCAMTELCIPDLNTS